MVSKMEIKWDKLCEQRSKKGKEAEWEWLKARMEAATETMKQKRASTDEQKNWEEQDKLPSLSATSEPFEATWERPLDTDPQTRIGRHSRQHYSLCPHSDDSIYVLHLHGRGFTTSPGDYQAEEN
jgi:hypothetical protein